MKYVALAFVCLTALVATGCQNNNNEAPATGTKPAASTSDANAKLSPAEAEAKSRDMMQKDAALSGSDGANK